MVLNILLIRILRTIVIGSGTVLIALLLIWILRSVVIGIRSVLIALLLSIGSAAVLIAALLLSVGSAAALIAVLLLTVRSTVIWVAALRSVRVGTVYISRDLLGGLRQVLITSLLSVVIIIIHLKDPPKGTV